MLQIIVGGGSWSHVWKQGGSPWARPVPWSTEKALSLHSQSS
jgi:hypothetical protein